MPIIERPICDKCRGEDFEDEVVQAPPERRTVMASDYVTRRKAQLAGELPAMLTYVQRKLVCKRCKAEYPYVL